MGIDLKRIVGDAVKGAERALTGAQAGVDHAVDTAKQNVARVVDSFGPPVLKPLVDLGSKFLHGSADKPNDGQLVGAGGKTYPPGTPLDQIAAYTPSNTIPGAPLKPEAGETFIYVNGISTTKEAQERTLQAFADRTGGRVIGIHNATEGAATDLLQALGDKLDLGKNPAVDSLADTVYGELKAGRPVHLLGHSQGALITSRALTDVKQRLMVEDGMTREQAEALLSNVKVETFGGAAANYPDGPQYVHYINEADLAPDVLGLDQPGLPNHAGRDARFVRFNSHDLNPAAGHSINDTYVPQRIPFDEARASGSVS